MTRLYTALALACCLDTAQAAELPRLAPPQAMFQQTLTLDQFVRGTLRFVLLHELGHGLVDLYDLPVLGREEDAADRFAAWWLSPDGRETGVDAIAAIEWWMASARQSEARREDLPWWDEHGIDEQRGYQIACLLYGADPQTMGPLAVRLGLPDERQASCLREAAQNAASWSAHLLDKTAQLPAQLDGFLVPVQLLPAPPALEAAAQRVADLGLMTELRDLLHQFRFPPGQAMVRLVAQDCEQVNAYWSPEERAVVLCYELVEHVQAVGRQAGFR